MDTLTRFSVVQFVRVMPTAVTIIDDGGTVLAASPAAQVVLGSDCEGAALNDRAHRKLGEPQAIEIEGQPLRLIGLADPSSAPADVAQLAGQVAHDFNNLLGVIINFTSLAAAELPVGSRVAEDLQEVLGAARRAAELTQHLIHLGGAAEMIRD